MPATYAHKKFGSMVYKLLPKDVRELVYDNLEYFLVGLNGPDVLFFYMTGVDTKVSALGHKIHRTPFVEFYNNAIEELNRDDSDEKLVYFLGTICHYMSDSACHPIVTKAIEDTGMTHGKIEKEFERYLLIKDGKNPMNYPCNAHLPVFGEVAEAAAAFYKGVTKGEFLSALASMKAIGTVCENNNPHVREALCRIMYVTGNSEKIAALMMSRQASRMAKQYMICLDRTMQDAVAETVVEVVKAAREYDKVIIASQRMKCDFLGRTQQ